MEQGERARRSLEGLSVGDAFGEQFFGAGMIRAVRRELAPPPWRTTDDTEMACVLFKLLEDHGHVDQDLLARRFASVIGVIRPGDTAPAPIGSCRASRRGRRGAKRLNRSSAGMARWETAPPCASPLWERGSRTISKP